ncbi:MAG: hypothetical protein IJ590_04380 [Rickettsiales bacterium]|nr:hypothetical protein [Rickettsiales bacterium]
MPEYIYIREVNDSAVHIGRTVDLEARYVLGADQLLEDFNDYFCAFECNEGAGQQIENDIKKEFKKYNIEREIYNYSPGLLSEYKEFLSKHNEIIRELSEDEILKYNKSNEKVRIIYKKEHGYKGRNLKEDKISFHNIWEKSRKIARAIQKNNDVSKYTEHDEFFTRYEDIEEMVEEVKDQFKGKVVFCNCDDPLGRPCKDNEDVADRDERNCSAFALYFKKNFKKLGLKKLICLHYAGYSDIFNIGETIGMIYTFDGKPPVKIKREADFDGSFYDQKSIDILNNEADIVCTNHPWSLTKRFYDILLKSKKKYLVISSKSIIMRPSFFDALKKKKIKAIKCVDNFLLGKNRTPARANGAWMTNLDYKRPPYKLLMPLKDIPKRYRDLDDNGILIVNNGYVPNDYNGEIAVSISPIINGILENGFELVGDGIYFRYENGARKYDRLLIKKSKK